MSLLFTFALTVFLQRNTRLFFFPLLLFFLLLWHWMPSLQSGALDRRLCSFPFWQRRLRRTCQLLSLWHRGHSFLFSSPSMLKYFRWSLPVRSLLVSATPTSLPFLSSYLTLALSSPPCSLLHLSFYLNLCQKLFSLFSSSIRLQWVPGHSFLPDDELARRGALLVPSAMPCSHSSFISGIHFSRTGGTLSHLNSSTHRIPRFPPNNLCFYVMLAVFSLAFAATDTAFC